MMFGKLLHDIEYKKGSFATDRLTNLYGPQNANPGYVIASELLQLPGDQVLGKATEINDSIVAMNEDSFAQLKLALDKVYLQLYNLQFVSLRERQATGETEEEELRTLAPMFSFSAPYSKLAARTLQNATHMRGLKCLVALRRWQLEHSQAPKNMRTIIKEAGLPSTPVDPYAGGPFQLSFKDGVPTVYSVGVDGKDNGGTVATEPNDPSDWLFRIRAVSTSEKNSKKPEELDRGF